MRKHDSPLPEEVPYQIFKKIGAVVSVETGKIVDATKTTVTTPTHANSLRQHKSCTFGVVSISFVNYLNEPSVV